MIAQAELQHDLVQVRAAGLRQSIIDLLDEPGVEAEAPEATYPADPAPGIAAIPRLVGQRAADERRRHLSGAQPVGRKLNRWRRPSPASVVSWVTLSPLR